MKTWCLRFLKTLSDYIESSEKTQELEIISGRLAMADHLYNSSFVNAAITIISFLFFVMSDYDKFNRSNNQQYKK